MKKFLILICLSMFSSVMLWAQSSMTDQQVMEYVIKENDKGTPRETIVSKLMQMGVSPDQLQRIRNKYEREHGKGQLGARDLSGADKTKDRLRVHNGEKRENKKVSNLKKGDKQDQSTLTDRQRALLKEQRQDEYSDELSFIFPDSLEMYDEIMGFDKKKEGKQVFGRNIFNRKNLNFEPEMNVATPKDYHLGPGDVVYVDVWGASNKSFTSSISPEGDIDIEGFGPINIAGLTVAEANQELRESLGQYYAGSNVKMSVGQTKTISINVMGEVEAPGTYSLSAFATVFHALYMAGGTNEIGTLRDIKVYRNNKLVTTVDIYDYILNGNLKGNVKLQSGDVVIVGPYTNLVNVTGKVKRPMYYEMKDKESVGTLIGYAGGFSGDAYQQTLRLIRKNGGKFSVYTIDEFERNKFQISDGDSVYVDSVLNRFTNMVELRGAVFRPGEYQMDGNVNTVRELLEVSGGLKEDAFGKRVIMHRRKADRTLEVIAFNGEAIMAHEMPDIPLKNEDVIFVPSREEIIGEQTLTIKGEVLYPGVYDFAENTTVEDLILQAGGLTDAASIVKVDVSRRIRDNKALKADTVVAREFTFSLKDGFVVDGQPGFVLEPYDEVFVRRSPGYMEQEHVKVTGEIAFAGEYVLTKKNLRLSDLVKLAGGLTNEAYAKGARLERELTYAEKLRQKTLLEMAHSGDSVNLKKLELGDTRYIGINLDKALENPGSEEWDVVLQKGDKLIIPQFNNTVSISGEVMYPNTVAYKDGAKLKYYINQAGGYGMRAKTSKVFAVNMNGTVTRVKSAKDIQPGCELVVPAKSKRRTMSIAEIMSMGTMTATIATVIATLVK